MSEWEPKTLSQRMRERGFLPRRQVCYAENGDVIPSWGYTEAREKLFDARQADLPSPPPEAEA